MAYFREIENRVYFHGAFTNNSTNGIDCDSGIK